MNEQSPSERPKREPRMQKLRMQHARETGALYRQFLEQYPEYKSEAYQEDTSPEFDSALTSYIRASGIIDRHIDEQAQLVASIKAEREQ